MNIQGRINRISQALDERPCFAVAILPYLRAGGGTRGVLLLGRHFLLLGFFLIGFD